MSKSKVLLVSCDGLGNGGVQHIIMNIVRNLSQYYQFDILLFTNETRYFDKEFLSYGGEIFRLPHHGADGSFRRKIDYYIRFGRFYRGVKKILTHHGPYSAMHCHNHFEAAPCIMAAAHCNVPVRISHFHGFLVGSHKVSEGYSTLLRHLLNRYSTHKLGCSKSALDSYLGINNDGISLPNAIDLTRFDKTRYPQPKQKHSFIHVGRWSCEKNQTFILDVFAKIQQRWTDSSLILVGCVPGKYQQMLTDKIEKLHLKNVHFYPPNSNIPALLAQSEYMIFPSLHEGFGLALAEAQAMDVKCFASTGCPPEANIGLCQFNSLQESPENWAKAILESENKPLPKVDLQKVDLSTYTTRIKQIYESQPTAQNAFHHALKFK